MIKIDLWQISRTLHFIARITLCKFAVLTQFMLCEASGFALSFRLGNKKIKRYSLLVKTPIRSSSLSRGRKDFETTIHDPRT
ncbi:MAG: hypothetical protein RSA67_07750, partial [Alistipes sp.]